MGRKQYVKVFYPDIDPEREEKVKLGKPQMFSSGAYHFSPSFKLSEDILDGILKKYDTAQEVYIKPLQKKDKDIEDSINNNTIKFANLIKKSENFDKNNILAVYKDSGVKHYFCILTKDKLYLCSAPIKPNMDFNSYKLREIRVTQKAISKSETAEVLIDKLRLTEDFCLLVKELQMLDKKTTGVLSTHPISSESKENCLKYMGFLVDRCVWGGAFTASAILHLEMIAIALHISSKELTDLFEDAQKRIDAVSGDFIVNSMEKTSGLPDDFGYVLYHDMIMLDYIGTVNGIQEKISDYTKELRETLGLEKDYLDKYEKVIYNFLKATVDVQGIYEAAKDAFVEKSGENKIVDRIFDSITFEYEIQKNKLSNN